MAEGLFANEESVFPPGVWRDMSRCSVFFSFEDVKLFFNPKKIELSVKLLVKRVLQSSLSLLPF